MDLSKLIQGRMAVVGRLSENAKVPSILASGALLLIRDKENIVLAQKVHKVFLSCTYSFFFVFMCGRRRFLILQKK